MKSVFFIFMLLVVSSCSSYKWVDLDDCKEKVNSLGKCRIIE